MKNLIKEQIEYLKDNPEGLWFKRKLYGYGWTPATREGWLVTLMVFVFIVGNAIRFEQSALPDSAALAQVILPTFAVIALLILVCLKKGEKPKWQWGGKSPEETSQEVD